VGISEASYPDWPINGPRTITWVCEFINRRGGGGPVAYHQWWQQSKFLSSGDPKVKLHNLGCQTLEWAGTFDCLDVSNLVCLEYVLREVQKIEHEFRNADDGHHVGKGGRSPMGGDFARSGAIFDQDAVFSGLSRDKGQIMCSPALLEVIANDLAVSTNVQKQLRKADEERALVEQKNKKGNTKEGKDEE